MNLKRYFKEYIEFQKSSEVVPTGFWIDVANYWSETEGNERVDNDIVRKRFYRRFKKLKKANYSDDVLDDILKELDEDDKTYYGSLVDTYTDNKVNQHDYEEYITKKNWSKEAENEGVADSYQAFLKEHNIREEDVVNVYFKQKASGTYFTVQKKYDTEELSQEEVKEEFIKSLEEYKVPDYSKTFFPDDDSEFVYKERVCFINAFDAHLDKITFIDTTDSESSLDSNIEQFERAFDKILRHAQNEEPELIVFPIGNDYFHVNGSELATKKGTEMKGSVYPNYRESFRKGLNLLRRCIDKMRFIAPVELRFIRGNHDSDQISYLLECLLLAYEDQNDVNVVDNIKSRQYKRYGKCLFGMAHGDKERRASQIPQRMSTDAESKKHWSDIDLAVFFLGDIHHEKKYKYMDSVDFGGVHVKFLRSMSQTDTWHWEKGFNGGLKTLYCFVYSKDGKEEIEFKTNI